MNWAITVVIGLSVLNTIGVLNVAYPSLFSNLRNNNSEFYIQVAACFIGSLWFIYGAYQYRRLRKGLSNILLGSMVAKAEAQPDETISK
jgi:hypothetical protein